MSAAQVPQESGQGTERGPEQGTDQGLGQGTGRGPGERRRALVAGLAVFLLALGVRLAFVDAVLDSYLADERDLISDVGFYDERGREIAEGDIFGREPGYLSPVYCAFLGLLYAAGGDLATAKLVQAGLGALTCLLVFLLARTLFGWRAGALAGGVFALYGMHVFYSGLLLPTVLVVLFNLGFLVVAVTGARPPTPGRLFAAGVLLGLAIGCKPNALLLLPAAMAWFLLGPRELELVRRIRLVGALFFGVVLTLAPVTWRNYQVSGELVLVSVVGGRNLLKGNGPEADGSHVFLPQGEQGISLQAIRTRDIDPALAVADDRDKKRATFEYMRAHPVRALRLFGRKLLLMLNARELGIRDQYDFARARFPLLGWLPFTFGMVVPLGLVGLAFTLRRPAFALVHLTVLVQLVSFVVVFVLGRYRLVMVACLAVLAAGHVLRLIEALRARETRTVFWSFFLWAAFLALALLPTPDFPEERGWADQYACSALRNKELERWDEALVDWVGALETSWSNPYVRFYEAQLYVEIARCQVHLGRTGEARRALESAEEAFPGIGPRARPEVVRAEMDKLYEALGDR